ncbi:MAG TPA: hypothetical protein VMM58_14240 [Bacteroidota bacterium]|nr:hypothetical protein [Bacteroidota bacterium]
MKRLLFAFTVFVVHCSLIAQITAGDAADIEPRYVIDTPTAGLLKRGAFAMDVDFFQNGGMTVGLSAGALDRLMFGISYGGSGIIGQGNISMQKLPGINVKYRLIDETIAMPAIAFGFDSQGKETYIDSTERFKIKSRGFFAAASKNYSLAGNLSIHGGTNYSLENKDGNKALDFFAGVEKSLGSDISLLFEYDFGLNDNIGVVGRGRGYLNGGIRWSWGNGFTLGADLKDLVKNQDHVTVGNRTIKVEYVRTL